MFASELRALFPLLKDFRCFLKIFIFLKERNVDKFKNCKNDLKNIVDKQTKMS